MKKRFEDMTPEDQEAKLKSIKEKLVSEKMKFSISPSTKINKYPEIQQYFRDRIFSQEVLITDDSYLIDFDLYLDGVRLNCLDKFGVDIQPALDKKLGDLLEYISQKPKSSITVEELASQLGLTRKE